MSDKVQKALEARKKRKEGDSNQKSTDKVSKALEARKNRINSNISSVATDIGDRYNSAIDSYKDYISKNSSLASGTYSEGIDLKSVLDDQREQSIAVSNLIRDIEAYRGYLGDDIADKALEGLTSMSEGYKGILKNAETLSQFKTKDDYDNAVKDSEKLEKWATPEYLENLSLVTDTFGTILDVYDNWEIHQAGTWDKEQTQKSGVITYYDKADEDASMDCT